jgi:RNA polymerase sigma-70 factor (ECF subfamily)
MADEIRAVIDRARQGDRAAFGWLVRKYQRRVYLTAARIVGSHEDADDVAQEAFVRAYRAIGSFKADSDFFTWLYRIVVNVALNHLRSRKRRNRASVEWNALPDGLQQIVVRDPGREVELRRMMAKIQQAMLGLPDALRVAVVLVLFDGMSYRDAAAAMGCSEGTVAWRVHEGRNRLRARLAEHLSGDCDGKVDGLSADA